MEEDCGLFFVQYKNDMVKVLIESADFIAVQEVSNQEILSDIQATNLDLGETEAIVYFRRF